MKVAYCFLGHVRTYLQTYRNFFDNVFSQAPGDIFIHTWSETSNTHNSWWVNMERNKKFVDEASKPINTDEIVRIYKPKDMLVEHQRSLLPIPGWKFEHNPYCLKIAFESCRKSVNLAKKHGPYDRIFITRMDLNFINKLNPNEFLSNKLHVSPHSQFLNQGACSDIWEHGTQEQIDTVADFYWHIEEMAFMKPDKNVHTEFAYHRYLKQHHIPIAVSRLNFQVIRMFNQPALQFPPSYNYTGTAT